MVVVAVGLVGVAVGAVLGHLAFAVDSGDGLPDWRNQRLPFRVSVATALMVLSGLSAIAAAVLVPEWKVGLGVWAFAAAAPGLAAIDLAARRLPFAVPGMVALAAFAGLVFAPSQLLSGLAAAAAVAAFILALSMLTGSGGGLGDVVASGVAALTLAWAGWATVALFLVVAMLLSGLFGIAVRFRSGSWMLVPYGPFLIFGWWSALFISIVDQFSTKENHVCDTD